MNSTTAHEIVATELPTRTWEEIALAEFPIVTTSLKRPACDTLEFIESIGVDDQETPITRRWRLIGSAEYGLPRLPDLDVYVAILKLLEETNYRERTVHCTLKDICDIAGLKPGGRTYQRLKEAFTRFATTTYVAEHVFRDPKTKVLVPLETWETITESRFTDDARALPSYFEVGKRFLSRLQHGQLKPLDLSLWRELPLGLEKPLYHYLDKNLHGAKDHHEIGLRKLSERIALTGTYSSGHLERLLTKPLVNLVNLSFLSEFSFAPSKSRHDPVKLIVTPGPRAHQVQSRASKATSTHLNPLRAAQHTPRPHAAPTEADRLVRRFRQLTSGRGDLAPSQTELNRAAELLRGAESIELAMFMVEYACSQMKQSGWTSAQHFGAVLANSYPDRARAAFRADRDDRAAQDAAARGQRLQDSYHEWRARELDRRWGILTQEQRDQRLEDALHEVDRRFGPAKKGLSSITSFRSSMGLRLAKNALGSDLPSSEVWIRDHQESLSSGKES